MKSSLVALLGAVVGGCSLVIDTRSTQCERADECTQFGDAFCNQGVCVLRPTVSQNDAGSVGMDTSPGARDALGPDPCQAMNKPRVEVVGDVTSDFTLTCDKDYLLTSTVFVKAGVTLTIQKGTTILGHTSRTQPSVLIIQPGAKIIAVGTPSEPIVFTSALPPDDRKPGDWGGVILLGNAPVNVRDDSGNLVRGRIEGITMGGEYGGVNESDDSGILKYVRIEYAGVAIAPNNEVNGLTFGGVGRGTIVDYIQVRQSTDDCYEFFGGTVNAKHLICQYNGDDGFDWDNGYRGKLQFLLLQQDPTVADETNGFEGDNNPSGADDAPKSEPIIYNATLCGKNLDVATEQYGMLLRRSTRAHVFNAIVTGFEAGLDVRDPTTLVEVRNSIFFGNLVRNLAYEENDSNTGAQKNDDNGLDEASWLMKPEHHNLVTDVGLRCFDPVAPRFQPLAAQTANAATPPEDGFFDTSASYVGAFRDAADQWASGNWVVFSDH